MRRKPNKFKNHWFKHKNSSEQTIAYKTIALFFFTPCYSKQESRTTFHPQKFKITLVWWKYLKKFLSINFQLFLSCLEGIQSENLLKEIDQHRLFSNIRDICDANLKLWSFYFYPMVSGHYEMFKEFNMSSNYKIFTN